MRASDTPSKNIPIKESPILDTSPTGLETFQTISPPGTLSVQTQSPTYTKSNPLSLNDSYHYISDGNEIIVWFKRYELVDNYGIWVDACHHWKDPPGLRRGCWDPTIPVEAPKGKKFLFVFFSFLNTGNTSANLPGPEKFTALYAQGIILSPASSIQDNDTTRIEWIGEESESEWKYITTYNIYDYSPTLHPTPGPERKMPLEEWYIPFIVPDTFEPAESYVSTRFNEKSSAVWKFS